LTSRPLRHSYMKFSNVSENTTIRGARVRFRHPYSSHLRCHEQAGWGRTNWLVPGVGKL